MYRIKSKEKRAIRQKGKNRYVQTEMATSEWLLNQFEIYNKEIAPFSLQDFRFLRYPRMISSRAAWSEVTTAYRQIIDPNDTRRQGRFSLVAMDYLMELKAKGYDSIKNSLDEQPQVEKIFGKGASFGFANNGLGNEKTSPVQQYSR